MLNLPAAEYCPVCHHLGVFVEFHAGKEPTPFLVRIIFGRHHKKEGEPPHLHKVCAVCGYGWKKEITDESYFRVSLLSLWRRV